MEGSPTIKESEIQRILAQQGKHLETLEYTIEGLENRFSQTLRSVEEIPKDEEPAGKVVPGTQLGRIIEENNSIITKATNRIDDIVSRCEL